MTPLAHRVYRQLRAQVRRKKPSITYGELASMLDVHPRSRHLHAALGEVSNACRHHQLPCLPAIVWRSDRKQPSDGYYKVAHPRAHTVDARIAAWEREHARVVKEIARFPPKLDA